MENKQPLTLEMVIKRKMNPIDIIKYFKPDWDDDYCDYYLWNNTCFPFSMEEMIKQVNEDLLNEK